MKEKVTCNRCGYTDIVENYHPTASVYTDIRCPKCGSTDNKHNEKYLKRLYEAMEKK